MTDLIITAAHNYTAVGHGAVMTASSVRAGISRLEKCGDYLDFEDNPITVAQIRGMDDDHSDRTERLCDVLEVSLEKLLADNFNHDTAKPQRIHVFLGVASRKRPGPRYENSAVPGLELLFEDWPSPPGIDIVPMGNAAGIHAMDRARQLIESDPDTVCIIGAIDSLLNPFTFGWFEKDNRLKSETYERHHGLVAGEAVGCLVLESGARAERTGRKPQARVTGIGLAEEPSPVTSGTSNQATGLTEACRIALKNTDNKAISAVFSDLNGEDFRARQWSTAEMRCFGDSAGPRKLFCPAFSYGDIGAAHGVVLPAIVAQGFVREWLDDPVLVFCTDDHGGCGAVLLEKAF